jgi:hypothetical protein
MTMHTGKLCPLSFEWDLSLNQNYDEIIEHCYKMRGHVRNAAATCAFPRVMAGDVNAAIDEALNTISSTAQSSSNMKKELKHMIFENVSALRKLFVQLIELSESRNKKISELETLANHTMVEQKGATNSRSTRAQGTPSIIPRQELARIGDSQVALTRMGQTKLYSEVLGGKTKQSRHTLTVTSKKGQPPDEIKDLLKSKINSTDIKVGISTLKTLRDGRVQIETGSKEEIDTLQRNINDKCGDKVIVNVHKLRNPRLVIYSIPEDISTENTEDTLLAQNPELNLEAGDIIAKFTYNTKKHTRNLVIEVSARTRKLLIHKRDKLAWLICNIEDYLTAN